MDRTTIIDGVELRFEPPLDADQFEIECILLRHLAPGAAAGVAELAEAIGEELVKMARDVCLDTTIAVEGEEAPAAWDFARLLHLRDHLDSADPRLRKHWEAFTERLPGLLGGLIGKLTPEVTDRLDHVQIKRLFELVVLGRTFVTVAGKPSRIKRWLDFGQHSAGRPSFKWDVMIAALTELYLADAIAEVSARLLANSQAEAQATSEDA